MILEKIDHPDKIHSLTNDELQQLATELRDRIIKVVARTGGHIAPSLGTVEITLALLNVFDAMQDRIVWDVGHQSYAWKILTGRNERFDTLRQYGGLSGFTNIHESPYDAFSTGHSSTSISAALGMAAARDLKKEHFHSIAVIGDGALTGSTEPCRAPATGRFYCNIERQRHVHIQKRGRIAEIYGTYVCLKELQYPEKADLGSQWQPAL